jgi:D-alanyl-D-alanine dipeptidase
MDIDPEIFNEFQENLKQMTDLLGRNNAAMEQYLNVMGSLDDNSTAINQNTAANKAGSQAATDLANAEKQAAADAKKSQNNLAQAASLATSSLSSFGTALMSGQEGVGKFGSSLTTAGAAASKVAENFGLLGAVIGLAIQAFTKVGADAENLIDRTVSFRNELSKTAGTLGSSLEDISKLSAAARFSGERMEILQKATSGLGTSLAALGGTAGEGATQFMKIAAIGKDADEVRKKFGMLGVSQDRLLDMQAKYVDMQAQSGRAYSMQHKTMEQLQKESLAYATNLNRISTLTGESADEQQKKALIVQGTIQEQAKTMQENAQIQQAGGPNSTEGKRIQAQQDIRKNTENQLSVVDVNLANQFGQLMRTNGQAGELSQVLLQALPNAPQLAIQANRGQLTVPQIIDIFTKAARKNVLERPAAYEHGDAATVEAQGVSLGAMTFINKYLKPGTTFEQALQKAKDNEIKRLKTGNNEEAGGYEDLLKTQRDVQADYQDVLQKVIDVMGPMGLTGATVALTVAAYAAATALSAVALRGGLGMQGGGGGMFKNLFGKGGAALEGAEGAELAGGAEAAGGAGLLTGGAEAAGGASLLAGALPLAAIAAGAGIGYLGNKAGQYVTKSGHPQAGAGIDIASDVAGGALAGAGAGAPFAGIGAIPGAIIGGVGGLAYGLYSNWGGLWGSGNKSAAPTTTATSTPSQSTPGMPDISNDQSNPNDQSAQQAGNTIDQSSIDGASAGGGTGLIGSFNKLNGSILQLIQSVNNLADAYNTNNMGGAAGGDNSNFAAPTQFGGNMDAVLSTIRKQESGGNYGAQNPSSTASGAYQFTNPTWQALTRKYGIGTQYASAASAPPGIQDQIAADRVKDILAQSGGDVSRVPVAWYTGNVNGTSNAASGSQVSQYAQKWMQTYNGLAGGMGGAGGKFGSDAGGMGGAGGKFGSDANVDIGDAAKYISFGGSSGGIQNFSGLQPNVKEALIRAAHQYYQQTGKKLTLNSGARTLQDQQRLWNNRGNNPNPVSPPNPNAPHVRGAAVDIAEYNDPVALNALHAAGLYQTVRRDPVHFALQAANGGVFSGPDSGYPALLHGTEMIVPVDNAQHRAGSKLEELNNYTKSQTLKQFSQVADPEQTKQMKALMDKTSSVSGQGKTQIYDPAADRNIRLATEDNGLLKDIREGINKMLVVTSKTASEKSAKASASRTKAAAKPHTKKSLPKSHLSLNAPMGYLGGKILANAGSLMSKAKSALGAIAEKFGFGSKTVAKSMTGEEARAAAKLSAREAAIAEAKAARSSMGGLGAGAPAKAATEAAEKAGGSFLSKLAKPLAKIGGRALGPLVAGGFSGYEEYQADKKKGESTGTSLKKAGIVGTGAAVGAGVGELAGGVLGSFLGPVGTVLGATAGGAIGSWLGEKGGKLLADYMITDDAKKKVAPKLHPQPKHTAHKADHKTPELEDPRIFAIPRQTRSNLAVANVRLDNSSGTYAPGQVASKIYNEPAAGQNTQQHRPQEFLQQQQNNENAKHFEKLGSHVESLGHKMEQHTRAVNEGNTILRHIMHEQRN